MKRPHIPALLRKRLTRRNFLKTLGVGLVTAGGSYVYATEVEPFWVCVVEHEMALPNLPVAFDGWRLIHISDLHIGVRVPSEYLIDCLRQVGDLQPDLLMITGDIIHGKWDTERDLTERVLDEVPLASLGTYAVLGNHDYGIRWSEVDVADKVDKLLTDRGVRVLRNELLDIDGLQVAGIDDIWSPEFDIDALKDIDPAKPCVAMCHNPDGCDLPPLWEGFQGYILAGHTHGGQCKPPFLPPPYLPVKNRLYTQGLFDLDDRRKLYINPGLGYIRRARFNVRPEITVFTLRQA